MGEGALKSQGDGVKSKRGTDPRSEIRDEMRRPRLWNSLGLVELDVEKSRLGLRSASAERRAVKTPSFLFGVVEQVRYSLQSSASA